VPQVLSKTCSKGLYFKSKTKSGELPALSVYIYKKEHGSAEGYATQDESQTSVNGSAHHRNDKKKT
jgi:hypothetical protein